MRTITFVVLLILATAPEFAAAREVSSGETTASPVLNNQPAGGSRGAAATSVDNGPLELNALYNYNGSSFMDGPGAARETEYDRTERGIFDDWRDQMFKAISMYFGPRGQDPTQSNRRPAGNALDSRDGKIVMKLVLKETLKFSKERVVWFDGLVKALKYEVSSDKSGGDSAGGIHDGVAGDNKSSGQKGRARPAGNAAVKDRFTVKTGVRVRMDGGKPGLVSESEAGYGKASYFYKVNLDNRGGNSLGFRYVLGRNIHIQVERDFFRTLSPAANGKPSINLLQVGYRF